MFLKFIGCGSALNTSLGNNNAFIKEGESLLLIDCGSTAFSRLQSYDLLNDIRHIYVLITHRHPDHISSLGDLIFYAHFILKADIHVLTPDDENVATLLGYMGVQQELYNLIKLSREYRLKNSDFDIDIETAKVEHVSYMDCYGYVLRFQTARAFYSGDAKDLPFDVIEMFKKHEIDFIYQDICSYNYDGNPHMHIEKLYQMIPEQDRHRVFCMHFDENFDKQQAIGMGFQLVENFNKKI